MWNSWNTGDYSGMIAETISIPKADGTTLRAYYSHPLGKTDVPSIVLIPHMPGWDEWQRETARRFTEHGYSVVCPDIYQMFGTGTAPEVAQRARENGGVPDSHVMDDVAESLRFLKSQPAANGKAGVIGMCSGGRHTYLAACTLDGIDAAVDCWGGGVVTQSERDITPAKPVAPIEYTEGLKCPLLGIFGNEDHSPTAEAVDILEAKLKELGKDYTFYRYDGAGHAIWYYDKAAYRWEQAMDGWEKTMAFFDEHLKTDK